MPIQLYLDDAGHENDTPIVAVGGYVASTDVWSGFEDDWNRRLAQAWRRHCAESGTLIPGRPPAFHMSDLQSGHGGGRYRAWEKNDRDALILDMAATIKAHLRFGIARAIVIDDFENVIRPDAHIFLTGTQLKRFTPVSYLMRMCLEWISTRWPGRSASGPIDIFFEKGTKHLSDSIAYCRALKENKPWGRAIGQIRVVEKYEAQAQAADFLAYHAYRRARGDLIEKTPHRPASFEASLFPCGVDFGVQTADEMRLGRMTVEFSAESCPR